MHIKTLFTAAALAIGLSSVPSFAATLNVVGGQLVGASGVNVGGTLYDVEFVDGTCIALFDGCDETSDFTFTTQSGALAASQALLDQVFIDDLNVGNFDSSPELTFGISSEVFGLVITPYSNGPFLTFQMWRASNFDEETLDGVEFGFEFFSISEDTSQDVNYVFADWSVATVPLPAGGILLVSALGGIAALRRRKKSTV